MAERKSVYLPQIEETPDTLYTEVQHLERATLIHNGVIL